ncbi:MAG: hypothetical protein AAF907_15705, partial [Planctomycetota bacterium]
MSRRRRSGESESGSDSFLDVLANLVGILVVLVVMTALQAAVTPSAAIEAAAGDEPAPNEEQAEPVPPSEEPISAARAPLLALKPRVIYEQAAAPAVSETLQQALADAEQRASELRRRLNDADLALATATERAEAERVTAADGLAELRTLQAEAVAARAISDRAAQQAAAARLDRDLWAAKAAAAMEKTLKRLEHSALPVGRRVEGAE